MLMGAYMFNESIKKNLKEGFTPTRMVVGG